MWIPMDMGMEWVSGFGTVMNPHWPVRFLWGFLNRCEIERKRVEYTTSVMVDV